MLANLVQGTLKLKVILFYLSLVFLMGLYSCQENEIYYKYHQIKDAKWHINDTLIFEVDSTLFELGVPYDITIEVSNNVNYPYQNIWFFIQSNFASSAEYSDVSAEYFLADEYGKWQGSGFGSLYQISLMLHENFVFNERRNYSIKIEHGMRDEPLVGIEKLGIRIVKK